MSNEPGTHKDVTNIDALGHVTGTSIYVDDIPVMQGTVYIKVFGSPLAHGIITDIDFSTAEHMEGVVKVFTYKDIPGRNQIGGIVEDEPLLAEKEVHFQGQPILLIVAETEFAAEEACESVHVSIKELPIIVDPRAAADKGHFLHPSRTFSNGDIVSAFNDAAYIFEGKADTGGQEHLYLETQGSYAYLMENGSIKVHCSTQGPTQVQRAVCKVLGLGMNRVEVDVTRLGGGFGGKEDQANAWAAMSALVAQVLKKPAKCILHRMDDMRMTGKRHPYSSDYKIGLDKDYNIIAYQATFYQNGGAATDLSPAILERTLFHATNCYAIPNVHILAHACKTNLPPNTAFRGFGGPQGMFVIEAAIDHAARELKVSSSLIQEKNLLTDGYEFSYGQVVEGAQAQSTWNHVIRKHNMDGINNEIRKFNTQNKFVKKGMAVMPVCFGISFTNTMMNQARALVHVYSDGTVGVSTGAVEMGQGVNTKMLQIAAREFGLSESQVKLETTNTTRVANTSPSAASATADLNGKALIDACRQIKDRLNQMLSTQHDLNDNASIAYRNQKIVLPNRTVLKWLDLVNEALSKRINLSAKGHYATPKIKFDKSIEKGHPFAYHVYGTSLFVATVDCIRGTYEIDEVDIVHDTGSSMNRLIDLGQIEGGLVQGMGWMTMEEVAYNQDGRLLTNALSTYKIPDIYSVPKIVNVDFLDTDADNMAIYKSKAVGEPPLMYGIGAYFAIQNAVLAYNPLSALEYNAPMTPEKVLLGLYTEKKDEFVRNVTVSRT